MRPHSVIDSCAFTVSGGCCRQGCRRKIRNVSGHIRRIHPRRDNRHCNTISRHRCNINHHSCRSPVTLGGNMQSPMHSAVINLAMARLSTTDNSSRKTISFFRCLRIRIMLGELRGPDTTLKALHIFRPCILNKNPDMLLSYRTLQSSNMLATRSIYCRAGLMQQRRTG
jgi:hypothetical protein